MRSQHAQFKVVPRDPFVHYGVVKLGQPLLPCALLLAFDDAAADLGAVHHVLMPVLEVVVSEEVIVREEEVGVVVVAGLGGAEAELLVEPIRISAIAFPLTLLFQSWLDVDLELLRVAPGATLLFEHFASELGDLLLWLLVSVLWASCLLLKLLLGSLPGMLQDALYVEGVATVEEAHFLAGLEATLIRALEFLVRVLVESVEADYGGADEGAAARVHHQLLLLLLVSDLLVQELVAFVALSVAEEDASGLVLATILKGVSDLPTCSPCCVEEYLCLAADFAEDCLDHLTQFVELQVFVVAHDSLEQHTQLDVIQASFYYEVQS